MRSLFNNYEVGTIIQDAAFFSTTRTKSVVDKVFSSANDPDDNILYIITHSFSGRFVNGISHFKGEDEVLFQPGTRFYVYKSEGNTVWMHEMYDDEEFNILALKVIANRDFDVNDEGNDDVDEVFTEEEVDVDDDEETPYFSTVAPGGEDHGCFVAEHQLEWYPDWYAQVYPEWYYSTVEPDMEGHGCVDVDVEQSPSPLQLECSGSVWKDGRRRSARLLAKKGGSKAEPLLGSTVDHLGRRRSLRLQQKKQ
jgi:hypothetical protein